MHELLTRFNSGELLGLFIMGSLAVCGLAGIIGGLLYAHRKLNIEASLKQEMLTRGMSVEEIKEVLGATKHAGYGSELAELDEGVAKAKLEAETKQKQAELEIEKLKLEASLKQAMVERGMSPDDIRDVLEAHVSGDATKCGTGKTPLKEVFDFVKGLGH
jgi:SOS response regulatory protein OraA/RecX